MTTNELEIWTICESPSDYPGKYTLRRHVIAAGLTFADQNCIISDALEPLRARMRARHLHCLGRLEHDDPVIVESWI
jgi:DNA-binding IclR family transcriptional regulator